MKTLFENFRRFINEDMSTDYIKKAQAWGERGDIAADEYAGLLSVVAGAYGNLARTKAKNMKIKAVIASLVAALGKEENKALGMDKNSILLSAENFLPWGEASSELAATPLANQLGLAELLSQDLPLEDHPDFAPEDDL